MATPAQRAPLLGVMSKSPGSGIARTVRRGATRVTAAMNVTRARMMKTGLTV